MKLSPLVLALVLACGLPLLAQDGSAPNPYLVQPDSPYYVPGAGADGAGPKVGRVGDPGDAVAPDQLGVREEVAQRQADARRWAEFLAAVSRGSRATTQSRVMRERSAPPVFDSPSGPLEVLLPQPVAALRAAAPAPPKPQVPLDPAVAAWATVYETEAGKLLTALDRADAAKSEAGCQALDAAIRASRIPHAPRPDLEASGRSALSWLVRAVESCKGGFRDATSLRLERAREAFASLETALGQ